MKERFFATTVDPLFFMARTGRIPIKYPIDEMIKYYQNGHTMGDVCTKFNLCRTTLARRFKKYGISFGYKKDRREFIESINLKTDECIEWPYGKNRGYGCFRHKGVILFAHRYSYQYHIGDIPNGLFVLHKCDNPACFNPNHLFVGSTKDNMIDMMKKERCGTAKLNNEKARKIKILIKNGLSDYEIGNSFSVCHETIRCIRFNKTWKHIKI